MRKTTKYIVFSLLILGAPIETEYIHGEGTYEHDVIEANTNIVDSAIISSSPIVAKGTFTRPVTITAYSSRVEETDSTPFITASGSHVRPGVVAANWLPIGTKIRIPDLFGGQVFTVEDRMHKKNGDKLDIWFADTKEAVKFGVKRAQIEIL